MNKRGGLLDEITPEMIIAILIIIVVIAVFVTVIKSTDTKFSDRFCRFKSSIMTKAPNGPKAILSGILDCGSQGANADGNDWSKCPGMEDKYKACKDQTCANDVNKDCAAYQIAKLVERCWWRYLSGGMEAPTVSQDLDCYTIHTSDFSGTVDTARVKEFIDSNKMSRDKFGMTYNTVTGGTCESSSNRDYNMYYRDMWPNSDDVKLVC